MIQLESLDSTCLALNQGKAWASGCLQTDAVLQHWVAGLESPVYDKTSMQVETLIIQYTCLPDDALCQQ
jgi:hypothetical protein